MKNISLTENLGYLLPDAIRESLPPSAFVDIQPICISLRLFVTFDTPMLDNWPSCGGYFLFVCNPSEVVLKETYEILLGRVDKRKVSDLESGGRWKQALGL